MCYGITERILSIGNWRVSSVSYKGSWENGALLVEFAKQKEFLYQLMR